MTRTLLLAVALTACLAQDLSGPVVRVIDGDTIVVQLDGAREHVRYIGIDTPEMDDERPAVRRRAAAAKEANARLVDGRRVRLELDAERRDRYGRLLAYVWVGDTLVNEVLVRTGHAAPYTVPPNVKYADRFLDAARDARVGTPDRSDSGVLTALQASAHVGEVRTVCDRVASTRFLRTGRQPTFLNLGHPYPEQDLTVVIWGEDRARFGGAPEELYRSRRVCVTGRIELYRGRPEIVIRERDALRAVD
jgi:micrococcal nuclease